MSKRLAYSTFILAAALFGLSGCGGNSSDREAFQDIIEQLENTDFQSEDTSRTIAVYTDSIEFNNLKNEVFRGISERQEKIDSSKTIAERYVEGDHSLKLELIRVLKDPFSDDKSTEIWYLNPYDQPDYRVTDREIIDAIQSNLYDEDCEYAVIEIMIDQKFPDYERTLTNYLLDGLSSQEGQILLALAELHSQDALDYMDRKTRSESLTMESMNDIVTAYSLYLNSKTPGHVNKVLESCFYILEKDKILPAKFEELNDDYAYDNPAQSLLSLIFEYGISNPDWLKNGFESETIYNWAKKMEFSASLSEEATAVLILFEGEVYRRNVIEKLKFEDTFSEGIRLAGIYYDNIEDERMIRSVITNFDKLYGDDLLSNVFITSQFFEMLDALKGLNTETLLNKYVKNDIRRSKLLNRYKITKRTTEEIIEYLTDQGFTKSLTSGQVVDTDWDMGRIYDVLNVSGSYFWIDSESSEPIENQERFINEYKSNSHGILDNLQLFISETLNVDEEKDKIVFKAVLNEKGYVMSLSGKERYDYALRDDFQYFINFILSDQGYMERFLPADYDSYIFGTPGKISRLSIEFDLGW